MRRGPAHDLADASGPSLLRTARQACLETPAEIKRGALFATIALQAAAADAHLGHVQAAEVLVIAASPSNGPLAAASVRALLPRDLVSRLRAAAPTVGPSRVRNVLNGLKALLPSPS